MSGFFPTSYLIYFFLLELIELFPLPRPISSEFNSVKNEKRYEPLVEEITPSLPANCFTKRTISGSWNGRNLSHRLT